MQITTISVATSYLYNLGDYNNIKTEVHLTAQLSPDDDYNDCVSDLQHRTLRACYQQIDNVLEKHRQPAAFSPEPRFSAYIYKDENVIFLMPDCQDNPEKGCNLSFYGYRELPLLEMLQQKYPGISIIREDFPKFISVFSKRVENILFIGNEKGIEARMKEIPVYFDLHYQRDRERRIWESFHHEQELYAIQNGLRLIDLDEAPLCEIEAYPEVQALKAKWEDFQDEADPPF